MGARPPEKGTRGTVLAVFLQSPCPRVCGTGGQPERHRPWGPDPAAPPTRTQPERGPGSAARARLRQHRIPPFSSSSSSPPARRGTRASGPAPTHRRLRGVRRGRGSVGWDPRGGPAVFRSPQPRERARGARSRAGGGGPASCSHRPSGGVWGCPRSPPGPAPHTRGVHGPRSPLGEPVAGPREGHGGGRVRGAGGKPHARIPPRRPAGPAPARGAHAAAGAALGRGERAAPPPCAKTPGQGSTPKPVPPGFARAPRRPQPPQRSSGAAGVPGALGGQAG